MNLRDTIERLFWTFVAAFVGALIVGGTGLVGVDLDALEAAAFAGGGAVANFILLVARARLKVLPDPGDGLPGLPVIDV